MAPFAPEGLRAPRPDDRDLLGQGRPQRPDRARAVERDRGRDRVGSLDRGSLPHRVLGLRDPVGRRFHGRVCPAPVDGGRLRAARRALFLGGAVGVGPHPLCDRRPPCGDPFLHRPFRCRRSQGAGALQAGAFLQARALLLRPDLAPGGDLQRAPRAACDAPHPQRPRADDGELHVSGRARRPARPLRHDSRTPCGGRSSR